MLTGNICYANNLEVTTTHSYLEINTCARAHPHTHLHSGLVFFELRKSKADTWPSIDHHVSGVPPASKPAILSSAATTSGRHHS